MGAVYVVMMRMLCLSACLQSEDNRGGVYVDRSSGMVVDNKSKEDKSMQGDVMLVGDELVHFDFCIHPMLCVACASTSPVQLTNAKLFEVN